MSWGVLYSFWYWCNVVLIFYEFFKYWKKYIYIFFFPIFQVFFAFHAISNIKKKMWCRTKKNPGGGGGGGVDFFFFLENQFFLISRFMLFSTLKKKYIEKFSFTYWLNGRWFLQIVERDSWDLYPLSSIPLFWFCVSNVGVVWGGGGCNVFLTFYAISNISRKKNLGIQNNDFSFNVFFLFFFCVLEILYSAPSLTATG